MRTHPRILTVFSCLAMLTFASVAQAQTMPAHRFGGMGTPDMSMANASATAFRQGPFSSAMSSAMAFTPTHNANAFSSSFSAPGQSQAFSSTFSGGMNGFHGAFGCSVAIGGQTYSFGSSFSASAPSEFTAGLPWGSR